MQEKLDKKGIDSLLQPAIPRRSVEAPAPLSFSKQRLWFLDQLEPNSALYNIYKALPLNGSLDVEALTAALSAIVDRHEALRTTFHSIEGEPVQVIENKPWMGLTRTDLGTLPEHDCAAELDRLLKQEAQRPFNLSAESMLRASLFRMGKQEHVLLLVMHHIASDGWSMGVLLQELAVLYDSFSNGNVPNLPHLPIQYADFALWQREQMQGDVLSSHLSYWTKQLKGIPALLDLVPDRPRPPVQRHRGRSYSFRLSRELAEELKLLSRQQAATLFMTLLTAFNVLLHSRTGQVDLVVGSPIAGRTRPEVEGLIGFFVNTLVLRTDLSGNPTLRELLDRVRKAVLEALDHQDLPFDKLVEALHPKRHADHRSLVQVAFAFQNVPREPTRFSGLTTTPVPVDFEVAKLDLTLFMWETEGELAGSLNYNADLFEPTTIKWLVNQFQSVLETLARDPDRPLKSLSSSGCQSEVIRVENKQEQLDIREASNLTRSQLLIWAGQKVYPEAPIYNVVNTYRIRGEIDRRRFEKAFGALVRSVDVLRTVITEDNGVPRQSVMASTAYPVEYINVSQQPNPETWFDSWAAARAQVCLDLARRLFDCALIKIAPREFLWYFNVHHIVTDGQSMALMFGLMSEFYESCGNDRSDNRTDIPSFQDYVNYERSHLRSKRYRQAQTYWQEKLADKVEPLSFYGTARNKTGTRVRRISYEIGVGRTRELRRIARRPDIAAKTENASMFNIFAALLFVYLHRITGSSRPSIGTPYHNRKSIEFKNTPGLFMEVLPLRINVEDVDTFVSLIRRIGVEASNTFRFTQSIGNSPGDKKYEVLLNYHTAEFVNFAGFPAQKTSVHTGHENDSLALQVHDFSRSGSLILDFDFHRDVFDDAQCKAAVGHLLRLMDAFLADPRKPIRSVDILLPGEREQITKAFNVTQTAVPRNMTLPALFEDQVRRTGAKVAVSFEGASLTYSQLNNRANGLAEHLKSLGVGADCIVGVCAEPSLETIVGLLAILKAGAAYMGLDPEFPKDRLAFMLRDSHVSVLLSQRSLLERYPYVTEAFGDMVTERAGKEIVLIDEEAWRTGNEDDPSPADGPAAENLAYVVYTSGSTGTPKGVMVHHGGVCNRLLWGSRIYGVDEADRVLHKSSISYDASIWEIFGALIAGSELIVAHPGGRRDSAYLADLIAERKITDAEFVPSMLSVILDEKGIDRCTSLKRVFSGGEALTAEIQNKFFARTWSAALYNTYGPTECSIDVTHYKCERDSKSGNVPIGRPVGNTQMYILDRYLNPVPIGVAGELHIGGAGLARGYLNRPELTAEKFIADPFSSTPGARLYKTGDLARYLPDGNIEFLGRFDHQVKIRGFRIELGEIETVLRSHPAVQQAVVTARQDVARDEKLLVAYVVGSQPGSCSATELHGYVKMKLPSYMLPAAFVFLDALPATASGKVNFQALPPPDGSRIDGSENFMAPRNPIESKMADIWSKLLGLDRVGVRDNFFDLGGHSLLAVRLFAEIEKAFEKRPPLASLFQEPTIEHLAVLINDNTSETKAPPSSLIAVQPQGTKRPIFCVHTFFGDVLCYMNLARHLGSDQPFYAIEARGLNGIDEPFDDIKAMAAYYIEQVRVVQPEGPYALAGLCSAGIVAFEMAQQLRARGDQVAMVALFDSQVGSPADEKLAYKPSFRDLLKDIPSWLIGSLELNHSQWLDLVKLKVKVARARKTVSDEIAGSSQSHTTTLIDEWGGFFQFSERHLKIAHAQSRALRKYRPQIYPGRLTLFKARMQPWFSSHRPDKGWGRLAAGGLDIRVVPGNQLAMLKEPHVRVLAEQLSGLLAE